MEFTSTPVCSGKRWIEGWVRWKVITHPVLFKTPYPYTSGHTGLPAANWLLASRLSCRSLICMQMHQQRSETNCEPRDSSAVSAGRCKELGTRVCCIKTTRGVLSCNYVNFCVTSGKSKLKTLLSLFVLLHYFNNLWLGAQFIKPKIRRIAEVSC